MTRLSTVAAAILVLCTATAEAELVRLEILDVESPTFEGREFSDVGSYERITARATLAVDPDDEHNAGIVDIALAPKRRDGRVEYVAPIVILKPVDLERGNGAIFYDVLNRGRKIGLGLMNDAPRVNDPRSADAAGNGFLMREGYTIVWSGWQPDVLPGEGRMGLTVPVLDGVTGTSRDEFIFDHDYNPFVANLSYPAASLDSSRASLTVRQRQTDRRVKPPDLAFEFFQMRRAGSWGTSSDQIVVHRPAGFDAGAIYEIVYEAQGPMVAGLAFASTRDVISFLRREVEDASGQPNPLAPGGAPAIDFAYALGISQSGRFLRDLLYQGFNEDEQSRVVFDGIVPHVAGSRKMFTNYRFAQLGRYSRQHEDHLTAGDQFPFTYGVLKDSVTGKRDGILSRCLERRNCPKIMHTDTATEFWQARSSLVVTDTAGGHITLPSNVRAYLMSSTPHSNSIDVGPEPVATCQHLSNPLHGGAPMRALLSALDAWVREGIEPPESRFPTVAEGTLVPPDRASIEFPAIPGVTYNGGVNGLRDVDYSVQPPAEGASYPVLVPKVDPDGHDVAGIRMPTVEAPLATYLGWNLRRTGFAEGALCSVTGSTIPLAATRAEREASGDPRLSIEERYPTHEAYIEQTSEAVKRLVKDRLYLEEDAARVMEKARRQDVGRPSS